MAMIARGVFMCDMRSLRLGKAVFSNAAFQKIICALWLMVVVFLEIDGVTFGRGKGGSIQLNAQSI